MAWGVALRAACCVLLRAAVLRVKVPLLGQPKPSPCPSAMPGDHPDATIHHTHHNHHNPIFGEICAPLSSPPTPTSPLPGRVELAHRSPAELAASPVAPRHPMDCRWGLRTARPDPLRWPGFDFASRTPVAGWLAGLQAASCPPSPFPTPVHTRGARDPQPAPEFRGAVSGLAHESSSIDPAPWVGRSAPSRDHSPCPVFPSCLPAPLSAAAMGWTYNTKDPDAPTIGPLIATGVASAHELPSRSSPSVYGSTSVAS